MDLRTLFSSFLPYKRIITLITLIFGLFGFVYYKFSPTKYVVSGSFYVSRDVNPESLNHFTYEGYYAQQAAASYAGTFAALFESLDVRKATLEKLSVEVNEKSLRDLKRDIDVKSSSPQLVTLSVEGESIEGVKEVYGALSETTLEVSRRINNLGDPSLGVVSVGESPVMYEGFSNVFVDIFIGFVFGFTFALVGFAIKIY